MPSLKFLFIFLLFIAIGSYSVKAESEVSVSSDSGEAVDISSTAISHVKNVSSKCLGNWKKQECAKEISAASMSMVTNYAKLLSDSGNKQYMEKLKQHCAASTAALEVDVPVYAMKSALVECINSIFDITEEALVKPDLTLYQLLIAAVTCIGEGKACKDVEASLRSFR